MIDAESPLNPYAKHLAGREPLAVLRATPAALEQTLVAHAHLPDRRPSPGRWSPREIVCHLADVELVHGFRLRQTLAQPHHLIQPFDQDAWAGRYAAYDLQTALRAFLAVRALSLALLAALDAGDVERRLTHPERGEMNLRILLETFAGHDLSHLGQLERTWRDLRT